MSYISYFKGCKDDSVGENCFLVKRWRNQCSAERMWRQQKRYRRTDRWTYERSGPCVASCFAGGTKSTWSTQSFGCSNAITIYIIQVLQLHNHWKDTKWDRFRVGPNQDGDQTSQGIVPRVRPNAISTTLCICKPDGISMQRNHCTWHPQKPGFKRKPGILCNIWPQILMS